MFGVPNQKELPQMKNAKRKRAAESSLPHAFLCLKQFLVSQLIHHLSHPLNGKRRLAHGPGGNAE